MCEYKLAHEKQSFLPKKRGGQFKPNLHGHFKPNLGGQLHRTLQVIFPLILTYNTNDPKNKELGKSLVSVQIILSAILSLALILSPFVQKALSLHFPLFLIPLTLFISIKVLIVIINGISLNKQNDLHKNLKINYL